MKFQNLDIEWLNHAAFKLKGAGRTIFIDPFHLPDKTIELADVIFITHEHFDHCSPADLKKIATARTVIITVSACKKNLAGIQHKEIKYIAPGDTIRLDGLTAIAIPAYNVNKFREPGKVFHPKEDGKVGFVITIEETTIYHAGDTDLIPEMEQLTNKVDCAFLPVSGTYVMTAEEAVAAAKIIQPKLVIPMHYGDIVGTIEDAQKFKQLSPAAVEVYLGL